ncbi:YfiT family bacillithiol transferase [Paenibacillus hodogayensis]|uniref:YfiT family bacillithiol transferase n=1 Tax=Paenibacillus hodogayensis TaxID=279208 RepID=A0ABV5VQS8_9BACL
MDKLRYPLGAFEPVPSPTTEQRAVWREAVTEMAAVLRQTVEPLSREQLLTPYRPGGWTVQQVIHHMADNDMNAFIRFKRALTEDCPAASSYREDLWAELPDYRLPVEASILLLESVHIRFAAVLRFLQPSDYARAFTSPSHGTMSLDIALQRFVWHDRHHIAQIAALRENMQW